MKKILSRITRIVLVVTIPFIIFTMVDFLTEITGGKLGDYLQDQYGITKKFLFIILVGFLLISLFYQIYEKWNEENYKSNSAIPQNIELNIENLENWLEKQFEVKYGKHIDIKFEVNEDFVDNINEDGFIRFKENQDIKVYSSKKVYARLGLEDNNWRKEFTVRYPIIEGIKNESINLKINSLLSYEKVFDISIEEFIEEDNWLEELDYTIKFLKKPFLNIELMMSGTAAYPTFASQNIVVNYETGDRIFAKDLFEKKSLSRLVSIINEFVEIDLLKSSIQEKYYDEIPLVKPKGEDKIELLKDQLFIKNFKITDLNDFSLEEDGINFNFNFGFPRVLLFLEPEGKYYFSFHLLNNLLKKIVPLKNLLKVSH